jgi:UDP-N-acetylglucosamine 2-epimerase (non-hydrolysing)
LRELLATLVDLSSSLNIIFPVHPRTRQRLNGLVPSQKDSARLRLLEPLPYLEFLALQRHAALVITDSGGIQEETTFLGIPCLTVRENTERPITIARGTNQLVGRDLDRLRTAVEEILKNDSGTRREPDRNRVPLWDGHAAERIAEIICDARLTKK